MTEAKADFIREFRKTDLDKYIFMGLKADEMVKEFEKALRGYSNVEWIDDRTVKVGSTTVTFFEDDKFDGVQYRVNYIETYHGSALGKLRRQLKP
jgi:hypothetical protein